MKYFVSILGLVAVSLLAQAQPKPLVEWNFSKAEDVEGWQQKNHITNLQVADGALKGTLMDWDPWVTSPQFEITANDWQVVKLRLRTDVSGAGQIFYTNTTESPYGGFFPKKNVQWNIKGDGEWHEYSIPTFWGEEKKIIMVRVDFARVEGEDKGKASFELDWVKVVQGQAPKVLEKPPVWKFPAALSEFEAGEGLHGEAAKDGVLLKMDAGKKGRLESKLFSFYADDGFFAVVRMATSAEKSASLAWVSSASRRWTGMNFEVIPDGKMHTYNIDLSGQKSWFDTIYRFAFQPPAEGETTLESITIADKPGGEAQPFIMYAGLEDAINRSGRPASLLLVLENRGGETLTNAEITKIRLPHGVRAVGDKWRKLADIESFDKLEVRIPLLSSRALRDSFSLTVAGNGLALDYEGDLCFEPALDLPKADYVPVPKPVESDYEIGALYFPGWPTIDRWARIWATDPQRKPVLGWYDEANPEVVDWQIKWAAENGIKFFMVDWYWHKGSMHLEHWIRAWEKARYRKMLKWCMMYANHNSKGSHSVEDQRAVTKYWIENFFCLPEYYQIDGKPVVMYWSASGLKRDMGGEPGGAKQLLDISRQMAKEAGYKGIHFIAMKWPEASTKAKDVQWLADEGFDMTSLYHFMGHGGKAENPRRYPFRLVADRSYSWWKERHETGILPFLPNLSTGWHSRPWHHGRGTWILDRNVKDFERICRDAKRFADETGIKRMVLAPLNEWGEGSYAEPNKEFGFGMYEAVRNTFCKKPAGGWPVNCTPSDVGLGPYDLPQAARHDLTEWDFSKGTQGWARAMGISGFKASDGALAFTNASGDPAICAYLGNLRASNYKNVNVRMKVTLPEGETEAGVLQLFWSTRTAKITERTSCVMEIIADGKFHDYVLPVSENRRWRGRLTSFRLDPGSCRGAKVEIERISLKK